MNILNSASKIVLIIFSLATVIGLFVGRIDQDTFKSAMLMVFTFYFANKGDTQNNVPFAGK